MESNQAVTGFDCTGWDWLSSPIDNNFGIGFTALSWKQFYDQTAQVISIYATQEIWEFFEMVREFTNVTRSVNPNCTGIFTITYAY